MNVIMVSSNHSFPYSLVEAGFNIFDLTSIVYAGEAPPADTYRLLTTRWGVGDRLATALIERCGGNLFSISRALDVLAVKKARATAINPWLYAYVNRCLNAVDDTYTYSMKNMAEILQILAEQGFVAVEDYDDEEVELIVRYGVGGLVQADALICGFDEETIAPDEGWDFGLVPMGQSMRLAIAKVLVERGLNA